MGVKGLWKLLLPIGRRISIETLAGQTLAIDASIWLTQFVKAMRDPETGKVDPAAHLLGFFRRICRLYYHGIKPVFVFDGATPEIKKKEVIRRKRQRDMFAAQSTEMTMQRLAKKLLSENIAKGNIKLKKKRSDISFDDGSAQPNGDDGQEAGGAFAPGFNPGAQRKNTAVDRSHSGEQQYNDDESKARLELEEILAEDPASAVKQNQREEVSDWDLPLEVAAAEEAKEMDAEENHASAYNSDDGFSAHAVASLPSHKRKDAIEKAKRAQRMQSRREFMPAAAKPEDFSNVQMRNFLKHCRLVKDIESMAKIAASRDGHDGQAMASDLATRIELIRENEDADDSDSDSGSNDTVSDSGPTSLLEKRVKSRRRSEFQQVQRLEHCDSSTENGDLERGEQQNGSTHQTRVLVDSSDESFANDRKSGGAKRLIHIQDSSSDDEDLGGMKLAASNKFGKGGDSPAPTDSDERMVQEMEDHQLAIALQNEDDYNVAAFAASNTQHQYQRVISQPNNAEAGPVDSRALRDANDSTGADSSDESVDWEDGEASNQLPDIDPWSMMQQKSTSLQSIHGKVTTGSEQTNVSPVAVKISQASAQAGHTTRMELPRRDFSCPEQPEQKNDDMILDKEVKWEEGAISSNSKSDLEPAVSTAAASTSSSPDHHEKHSKWSTQLPSDQDETSTALKQAQETASNLANWAGRAFKRAMREVVADDTHQPPTFGESRSQSQTKAAQASIPVLEKVSTSEQYSKKAERTTSTKPNSGFTLDENILDWTSVRDRKKRDSEGFTDDMLIEAKQLLQLFGIP